MKKLLLLLFVFASLGVAQKRLYSSKYPIEKPIVANAWDSTTSKNPLEFLIYNDTTKLWLDRDIDNPNQYRMRLSLRKTNLTSLNSYVGLQSLNSRADSGISLVGANANGEVFGSGRRVNAAGYPTGGLNRFFKFLNDSIIFYINASEAFKISSASAVTIGGTLGVTGATTLSNTVGITSGGVGLTISKTSGPSIELIKTAATAQTWQIAGDANFNIYDITDAATVAFSIALGTQAVTIPGTLGVTSAGTFSSTLRAADTVRSGNWTTYSYFIPGGALVQSSDSALKINILSYTANLANFKNVKPRTYNFKKELFLEVFDPKSVPDSVTQEVKDSIATAFYADNLAEAERKSQILYRGFLADEFNGQILSKQSKEINQQDVINAMWLKIQELEKRIEVLEGK